MRIKDKITLEDKKRKTYEFFVGKGLSPSQAAALTGNFAVESGFNTRIEGDKNLSSSSVGLAQWREDRLDRLKSMYDDPYSLDSQLEYVWWELNNTHRHALKALQQSQTPEEAAIAVRAKYEVAWDKHDDRRIQNTLDVLTQYGNSLQTPREVAMDTVQMPEKKIDNTQVTQKVINFPKQTNFPTFTGPKETKTTEKKETPTEVAKNTLEQKKSEQQFVKDILSGKAKPQEQKPQQQISQQPVQPYGSFILDKAKELGIFQEGGELTQTQIEGVEQYISKLNKEIPKFRPENDLKTIEHIGAKLLIGDSFDDAVSIYNQLVDFKNKRGDSNEMSPEEADLRKRISNANMFGYPSSLKDFKNFTERVKKGEVGVSSILTPSEEALNTDRFKVRAALNEKYYGLGENKDFLTKSKYRPSSSKDENAEYTDFSEEQRNKDLYALKTYYSNFDSLVNEVKNNKRRKSIYSKDKGLGANFLSNSDFIKVRDSNLNQLGTFKFSVGEDEKGRYVSYYDVWDIDPPMLKERGIDVDKLNNPFEIYGRIYEKDFNRVKK